MRNVAWAMTLVAMWMGIMGVAFGFEGGTKMVATMTHHPEYWAIEPGPAPVLAYEPWRSSKMVLQLLQKFPEPTLSAERIREETPGPSLGTKAVVLFQKGW